jgi:hypothetical protein
MGAEGPLGPGDQLVPGGSNLPTAMWTKTGGVVLPLGASTLSADASGSIYANTLYGAFRSDDEGLSWTHLSIPNDTIVAVKTNGKALLFGYGAATTYTSTDKGSTWRVIMHGSTPNIVYPDTSGRSYALYLELIGVSIRLIDPSGSITKSISVPTTIYAFTGYTVGPDGTIYVNSVLDGLLRTTDAGETWGTVSTAHPRSMVWCNERGILFLRDGNTIFASQDRGETWAPLPLTSTNLEGVTAGADGEMLIHGDGVWRYKADNTVTRIRSDGRNYKDLLVRSRNRILSSTGSGVGSALITFDTLGTTVGEHSVDQPFTRFAVHEFSNLTDSLVWAATSIGVLKSTDGGLHWSYASLGGEDVISISVSPRGFAAARSTTEFHGTGWSGDTCRTWGFPGALQWPGSKVAAINSQCAVSQSTSMISSWWPYQASWGNHNTYFYELPIWDIATDLKHTRVFIASDSGIYTSPNGASWTPIGPRQTRITSVAISPFGQIYFIRPDSGLGVSRDGGATWSTAAGIPTPGFSGKLIPGSTDGSVLHSDSTGIYLWNNGDAAWTSLGEGSSEGGALLSLTNRRVLWGRSDGIYTSSQVPFQGSNRRIFITEEWGVVPGVWYIDTSKIYLFWNRVGDIDQFKIELTLDNQRTWQLFKIVDACHLPWTWEPTDSLTMVFPTASSDSAYIRISALDDPTVFALSPRIMLRLAGGLTLPVAPTLIGPMGVQHVAGDSIRCTWRRGSPEVTGYNLYWKLDSDQAIPVLDSTIVDTTAVIGPLVPERKYVWFVTAKNTIGTGEPSTAKFTFTHRPAEPVPISPIYGDTVTSDPIRYAWTRSYPNATRYFLQVSDSPAFAGIYIADSTLSDTVAFHGRFQMGITCYWRVSARNETGWSDYGPVGKFTEGPILTSTGPTLVAPINGVQVTTDPVRYTWRRYPKAIRYSLELSSNTEFAGRYFLDSTITDTTVLKRRFNMNATYYWRVRAFDGSSWSTYSVLGKFTEGPILTSLGPTLVSPISGARVSTDSIRYTWKRFPTAIRYLLMVSSDSTFAGRQIADSTITDTTVVKRRYQTGVTFFWKVKAYDGTSWTVFSLLGKFVETLTGIESEHSRPSEVVLHQNYPNPFNPLTTIRFGLPERAYVHLDVFNVLGQRVADLVNTEMEAGFHEVQFEGSHLSSGLYFCTLRAGKSVVSRKILLTK